MRHLRMAFAVIGIVVLVLAAAPAWAGQQGRTQAKPAKVELPPAVAKAVQQNCPGAVIDKMDVEKEAGIALYDFEFKAGKGEIEVAADGTVMDIATVVALKDVPKPAAEAIQKAAAGATVKQIERSEIRAEVKMDGGKGTIVKLASPRYVYEAELVKGDEKGEVQVAPDGKIVEGPKRGEDEAEEKEEIGEKQEAEEKAEVLPPAVLAAFKTSYPHAVIKGTSKETENGVTYYEIESVDGKMNRDLLYAADGKAVEIEESVAPGALPAAVTQALAKAYPGCKVLKAEELTKDGRKLFELQIQVKDKKIGVTIDPAGTIVK